MKIVISGGKTGGHVFPALAVAECLRRSPPASRSFRSGAVESATAGMADLLYIGFAGGVEEQAVPEAAIPLVSLRLATPDSWRNGLRFLLNSLMALKTCSLAFRRFQPDAIFSTGGFVSLPAVLTGWMRRVPVVIYLPDVYPGKTVRLTSRFARRIAVTSSRTEEYLRQPGRVVVTGYPVRSQFQQLTRAEARRAAGLADSELQVVVVGGSQGAAALNQAVTRLLPRILKQARVLHVCGPRHVASLDHQARELPASLAARYRVVGMLEASEIAAAMLAADVGITRAGASILGELPAAALPSIVVPLPINAQDVNASVLEAEKACIVLPESSLPEALEPTLMNLLANGPRREAMRKNLERLARPRAAEEIAALLLAAGERAA